jgi:hypothetical protein
MDQRLDDAHKAGFGSAPRSHVAGLSRSTMRVERRWLVGGMNSPRNRMDLNVTACGGRNSKTEKLWRIRHGSPKTSLANTTQQLMSVRRVHMLVP